VTAHQAHIARLDVSGWAGSPLDLCPDDAFASSDLAALADDLEAGRIAGIVVPLENLRGRYEPVFELLTRRRRIKVDRTEVAQSPRGPVMFARLALAWAPPTGRDRTILMAHLLDRQGILYKILRVLYENDINIAHLNNRPDDKQGQFFHFDLEAHADEPRLRRALAGIRAQVGSDIDLEVLGSCPMTPLFPLKLRSAIIIGGTNGIGPLIGKGFFEREGVSVCYAGRHTQPPYAEIVNQFDCVMFAVPLDKTVEVIREIAPLAKSGAVLVDLASRKAEPVRALLEAAPSGCEVLGVHTVFGPATESLMGKNVVVTRTPRGGPLCDEVITLFRKRGTVLTDSTADTHDRLMNTVQTQWHRFLLACAASAMESGLSVRQVLAAGNPIDESALPVHLAGRILMLGENLLWGLQTVDGPAANEQGRAVATTLTECLAGPDAAERLRLELRSAYGEDDRARCALTTDGLLFTLHRAQVRHWEGRASDIADVGGTDIPGIGGTDIPVCPSALTASWRLALAALAAHHRRGRIAPSVLAEFSSPHFLLGLLAGVGAAEAGAAAWRTLALRADARPLLDAHARIGEWTATGNRAAFADLLGRLKAWAGDDFLKFALAQTGRVFEQVLVQQLWGLPRFEG